MWPRIPPHLSSYPCNQWTVESTLHFHNVPNLPSAYYWRNHHVFLICCPKIYWQICCYKSWYTWIESTMHRIASDRAKEFNSHWFTQIHTWLRETEACDYLEPPPMTTCDRSERIKNSDIRMIKNKMYSLKRVETKSRLEEISSTLYCYLLFTTFRRIDEVHLYK